MGDGLLTGKPSRYVPIHLGQLSLPSLRNDLYCVGWGVKLYSIQSIRDRLIEYHSVWLGLRRGVFTCVGWQVTLCDPIWQVTLRIALGQLVQECYIA